MAPNSEEGRRVEIFPWGEDTLTKEKQRPPIYNPEDYALSLKKWGKKPPANGPGLYSPPNQDNEVARSQSNSFRDYRNPMLTSSGSEMTLRQFGTVSELLSKLKADLRLAYPSFVQEFIADPLDGVTLLLDLLRAIQLSQANNGSPGSTGTAGKIPPSVQRRALLDELTCLQCLLCCCLRFSEGVRRLTASSAGLFTLAVCIMSNVNKSRIIALQLLTKACEPSGNGHSSVSEALSTLRLRFGEPVRFRFLVGMLTSAGGQGELLTAGMKFINTFLQTAESIQKRLYIQAELEQAGFDISGIKKLTTINSPNAEAIFEELDKWEKNHIDVETIKQRLEDSERENDSLRDKVLLLERRIQILQEEKGILVSLEQCLKERCSELQDEVTSLKSGKPDGSQKRDDSTPAEDEGISSSERSITPEDIQQESSVYEVFSMQSHAIPIKPEIRNKKLEQKLLADEEEETTIEEVMEEFRNIINDAESENYKNKETLRRKRREEQERIKMEEAQVKSKIQVRVDPVVTMEDSIYSEEIEIVPTQIHPHPPRRTRSLIHLYIPTEDYNCGEKQIFYENETMYTSDEDSDSLLSASKCVQRIECNPTSKPANIENNQKKLKKENLTNREILNAIIDAKERASLHERNILQLDTRNQNLESIKQNLDNNMLNLDTRKQNVRRSESYNYKDTLVVANEKKDKTVRQSSFDGLYYVTHTNIVSPTVTTRFVTQVTEDFTQQRIKSKSLDRIDDGLDSMVDIVMTSQNQKDTKDVAVIRPKSDSGNMTGTTLSRSTSNVYITRNESTKLHKYYQDEKQRMFLPISKYEDQDITDRYYFPRVQEKRCSSNSFLIKRGHANAGLYSGQIIIRDTHKNNIKKLDYCSAAVGSKTSSGKVTDYPSGLY